MEAARRRAVRDLREIAEEAEAPAGSDGAALRRRLAELRQRVLAVARALAADAPPPPPRRERRPPDPLRPHNAPAAAPAKQPPAPVDPADTGTDAVAAPDAVAAAAGRLAEAAYRALERLFGVVDADHREAPERRAASPLDATSQTRFRRVLEAVAGGRVRRCLDALDAAADASTSDDDDDAGGRAAGRASYAALQACWTRHRRDRRDPPRGSPEKRLSERLHAHAPCSRTGCVVCRRRAADNALLQRELGVNDEAGPRELWAAVARPAPDCTRAHLEASLWRAALLVRCHDRSRGLRLSRDEAQRKLLDLRCYELVLAYVRASE